MQIVEKMLERHPDQVSSDMYHLLGDKHPIFDQESELFHSYFKDANNIRRMPVMWFATEDDDIMEIKGPSGARDSEDFLISARHILLANQSDHFVMATPSSFSTVKNEYIYRQRDSYLPWETGDLSLLTFYCVSRLGSFQNTFQFCWTSEGMRFIRYHAIGFNFYDPTILRALPSGQESKFELRRSGRLAQRMRSGHYSYEINPKNKQEVKINSN